jgi:DNA-binding beta-propeller fold protein YncE
MNPVEKYRRTIACLVVVFILGALAALAILGFMRSRSSRDADAASELQPTGAPQLISVEPMQEPDGEMCQLVPASASTSLIGVLTEEPRAARPASAADAGASVIADRAPLRVISDPNPSFSAIAVEPNSNMLVVTDENLFRVLEYNRKDNTPAKAKLTEPKRVIGGSLTKAEMMCGVYIDPATLDTYVVNNDTQNWLAVFDKTSKGNVAPDRVLEVPHGTFGIAVDEGRQELFLTVQHQNEVIVYPKKAAGQDAPLRELVGDDTHLEDPHGMAVDVKDDLIFVSNHGSVSYRGRDSDIHISPGVNKSFIRGSGEFHPPSITVYKRDAQGNTPPKRIIEGSQTHLNWPMQIAVDEQRGELYVANDMDHSIVVFKTTDSGDVVPTRIIKGRKTNIKNPTGVALDLKNGELWVASMGNHSANVFPLTANGNVAPLRTVRGGPSDELSLMIGNPGAVGYDTKREQILVPN